MCFQVMTGLSEVVISFSLFLKPSCSSVELFIKASEASELTF
jgi:hypothetical protein